MRPEGRHRRTAVSARDSRGSAASRRAVERLTAAGPVLVHFFDFAQLNSVATLPYVVAWHDRYRDGGLTMIGVHSPRLPFTADRRGGRARLCAGSGSRIRSRSTPSFARVARLRLRALAVAVPLGSGRRAGLVSLRRGRVRGDRARDRGAARRAARLDLPAPLEPLRPTERPGALVVPPSEELFPGGSASEPWRASRRQPALSVDYAAGGAYATLDGEGELTLSLDGAEPTRRAVDAPGLYDAGGAPPARAPPARAASLGRAARMVDQLRARGPAADRHREPRQLGGAGDELADLAREHEADVLVHGAQLGDVLRPALAEELDELRDQLLGRAGARRDADRLDAVEPAPPPPGASCRSGASRRRARARPRRGGSSSRSSSSR